MLHLKGRRTGVADLAFSHCGTWLAAAGRGGVHVWNLHSPAAPPAHVQAGGLYNSAAGLVFFPNGRLFFRSQRGYSLYDPVAGRLAVFPDALSVYAHPVVAAPDGRWLATSAENGRPTVYALAPDGTVAPAWRRTEPRQFQTAAFSPDSAAVAFAGEAYSRGTVAPFLTVHAADTGAVVHDLKAVYMSTAQLLFSPDDTRLVARFGKGLAVYDLAAPDKKPKKAANPDSPHFAAAAFHPSGRFLATVTTDRLVRFWDATSWTAGPTFTWDIGKLYAVAFRDGSKRGWVHSLRR